MLKREASKSDNTGIGSATFKTVVASCCVLFICFLFLPLWVSIDLINDDNFTYWAGTSTPTNAILTICILAFVTWFSCHLFQQTHHEKARGEDSWLLLLNACTIAFGLSFILLSMPLNRVATQTYHEMTTRCAYADTTEPLYNTWVMYENLRQDPACKNQTSVEQCDGFELDEKNTPFLKYLETNYHCAGFCLRQPSPLPVVREKKQKTMNEKMQEIKKQNKAEAQKKKTSLLGRTRTNTLAVEGVQSQGVFPETQKTRALFSPMQSDVPCDYVSALHLRMSASSAGNMFYAQGLCMLGLAALMSLLKLTAASKRVTIRNEISHSSLL